MKRILTVIALLTVTSLHAMSTKDINKIQNIKFRVAGDLNGDSVPDLVIVSQDTLNEMSPYQLSIYFKESGDNYHLIAASDSAIEPQCPDGAGCPNENELFEVKIKSRVITFSVQYLRGNSTTKFRYQNGNFELIGFTSISSDGNGTMNTVDVNLSTGDVIEKAESYETDKVISNKKSKRDFHPLPKLQNFSIGSFDVF